MGLRRDYFVVFKWEKGRCAAEDADALQRSSYGGVVGLAACRKTKGKNPGIWFAAKK